MFEADAAKTTQLVHSNLKRVCVDGFRAVFLRSRVVVKDKFGVCTEVIRLPKKWLGLNDLVEIVDGGQIIA